MGDSCICNDCILLDCWHIDCIVVEFFFLTEPVCIAEAIKNNVEKLGIEHLKDKQRWLLISRKGRMSLFPPNWLWKITHLCITAICL